MGGGGGCKFSLVPNAIKADFVDSRYPDNLIFLIILLIKWSSKSHNVYINYLKSSDCDKVKYLSVWPLLAQPFSTLCFRGGALEVTQMGQNPLKADPEPCQA